MSCTLSKLKDFTFFIICFICADKKYKYKKHPPNVIKASRYIQKCDKSI